MATAPVPGHSQRAKDATPLILTLTKPDGTKDERAIRLGDVTAVHAGRLRRETGFSPRHLFAVVVAAPDECDIDIVAALWWLGGMQVGERETWEDAGSAFTLDTEFGVIYDPDTEHVAEVDAAAPLPSSDDSSETPSPD